MKKLNKLILMAVAICAAAISGACSSDEEPDRMFDDAFVSDMLDGRASAVIDINWNGLHYVKNEAGEWDAVVMDGVGGGAARRFIIENGVSYTNVFNAEERRVAFNSISWKIGGIWNTYEELTGSDTQIIVPYTFNLDIKGGKVQSGEIQLDIDKVDGNILTVIKYDKLYNMDFEEIGDIKECYTLTINPLKKSYRKTLEIYNTRKEGKLALVRKLRAYFGDYFDTAIYWKPEFSNGGLNDQEPWLNCKFNLALLEEDILNESDDRYRKDRYETYD